MDGAPTNDKDIKIAIIKAVNELVIAKTGTIKQESIIKLWQDLYDTMAAKALKK